MKSEDLAKKIRLETLKMIYASGSSHIGSAFSYIDILAVLYNEILNIDPKNPQDPNRDRFILSKGHACSSLYAALAVKGFFPINYLSSYGKNGSNLMNHVSHKVQGVEFSTGSLGHGLPFAVGKAKALKLKGIKSKIFVLIGDGELAEGSNFEAMLFASHHKLDNLILIIDNNNLQSLTTVKETLNIYPIGKKFEAFGWDYSEVDGHSFKALEKIFNKFISENNSKPKVLNTRTIKGKGISFMENSIAWHYKSPNKKELEEGLKQIENA
ncbi:MAG: transketolase [Flavobacteriaceae bacterium]